MGDFSYSIDFENNGYITAVFNYDPFPKNIIGRGLTSEEEAKEICQKNFENKVTDLLNKIKITYMEGT